MIKDEATLCSGTASSIFETGQEDEETKLGEMERDRRFLCMCNNYVTLVLLSGTCVA